MAGLSKIQTLSLARPQETPLLIYQDKSKGWINYDVDNLLPQRLLEMFLLSPTHGGVSKRKAKYISGADVQCNTPDANAWASTWDEGDGIENVFSKIALDLVLFGGFCLQVRRNPQTNMIAAIDYQDFTTVRIGFEKTKNADGLYDKGVYISADWRYQTPYKFRPEFYPLFNELDTAPVSFFYYSQYVPGYGYYTLPDYYGAEKSILTEIAITEFKLNYISNGLIPSAVLSIPGRIAPDAFAKVKEEIKNMTGPKNAGKLLVVNVDGDKTADVQPFNSGSPYQDIESYLNQARQDIIMAHQLPSPTIIGLPGGASLGGDGNTIETASKEFFERVIKPMQAAIINQLEWLFGYAGFPGTKVSVKQTYPGQGIDIQQPEQEAIILNGAQIASAQSILGALNATDSAIKIAPAAAITLLTGLGISTANATAMVNAQLGLGLSNLPPEQQVQ